LPLLIGLFRPLTFQLTNLTFDPTGDLVKSAISDMDISIMIKNRITIFSLGIEHSAKDVDKSLCMA